MRKGAATGLLAGSLVLGCIAFINDAAGSDEGFATGVTSRRIVPSEPYEWRGAATQALDTTIWYPADPRVDGQPRSPGAPDGPTLFAAPAAIVDAALSPAPARLPVILLSHGNGGTVQSLAWLAAGLAAHGYVVAGVNHPGDSAVAPKTVQGATLWSPRARDLSVVLDALLADAQFASRLDPARIGATGFSRGGYTAIALAGGIAAPAVPGIVCRACKPPPDFPDLIERSRGLEQSDPAYARALKAATGSARDPRVRAVFVVAPGLAEVMRPDSLAAINVPVAIIAGAGDTIVPPEFNARIYAAAIPGAALTILPGTVGHFTFLNECTTTGRQTAPGFCVDAPGVDRAEVHAETIARASAFFGAALNPRP